MKISSDFNASHLVDSSQKSSVTDKTFFTQKLTADEVKELRQQVVDNANAYTFSSVSVQNQLTNSQDEFTNNYQEFQSFLKEIGYNGQSISTLSKDEAAKLVSQDGIFGVKQTSQRIADFVIKGSGGDEDLMRAGREGMLQGFADAEKAWGDTLPDISQQTMKQATEMIDKAMSDLGFGILNTTA
jgi:hypothetical protein